MTLYGTKITEDGQLYEVEVCECSVSFNGVLRALSASERADYNNIIAAISGAADEDEYIDALEKSDFFIQSLGH